MWSNKVIIFLLLIGFNALCYAQDAAQDDPMELDKKKHKTTTTTTASSLIPMTLTDDKLSELEKKHKTTTTTTTTDDSLIPLILTEDEEEKKHKNKTTVSPTTSTTTMAPSPTTVTSTPITSSTEKSTTSTTKTTTTTTTTLKPSTTTPKPSTTTPPPSTTTTAKPSPAPKPDIGLWNCSCIRLQMAAELNFTYPTKDNKTGRAQMVVPHTAKLHDCACELPQMQSLVLEWSSEKAPNSLTLNFEKNNSEYSLYTMLFKIQSSELPNAKENLTIQLIHENKTFSTPLQMSYHCTRENKLNLTRTINSNEAVGYVSLTDLQFEAFYQGNETIKFSTAKDCDAIDTPDIVPIAVGIALIALILIVLISYLVARRRSTARGYMSF